MRGGLFTAIHIYDSALALFLFIVSKIMIHKRYTARCELNQIY